MQPIKCTLYFYSNCMHLEQLYTGLALLVEQGRIEVNVKINNHSKRASFMQGLGANFLKLRLHDGPMLFFDVHDNFTLIEEDCLLDDVDVYFKRSYRLNGYDAETANKGFKVLPLGFNYAVYGSNNFLWKRTMLQIGLKKKLEWFARGNSLLASLFKLNTSIAYSHVNAMHQGPQKLSPRILLMTRLWNPSTVANEYKKEIRKHLSQQRMDAVRALKKEFGNRFTGGLFIDDYSKQVAPDLLLQSNELAAKKNYLQQLRTHSIGVTVNGKFSAGWSFGENIAFSNAIVADGLSVKVPGSFMVNENFLSFDDTDECVEACTRLMNDKYLLQEMQQSNFHYYKKHLQPDELVWNAIQQTF